MFKSYWRMLFLITVPTVSFATQQTTIDLSTRGCIEHYSKQDFEQAFSECSIAAQKNVAQAQNILGVLYQQGQGVELDYESALEWFEKAAKAGDLAGQINTGKMYSKGWNWLSRPDYIKAFQHFSHAANQNQPEAQFIVALCYQNGLGVSKDEGQALYWYHQAVNHGLKGGKVIPASAIRTAQATHSRQSPGNSEYQKALTLKAKDKNSQTYLSALRLAAEKGHPQAQYELAIRYISGNEFSINDENAHQWLEKAAKQNHQAAQSYLAWMSMLGLGKEENQQEAAKWFFNARSHQEMTVLDQSSVLDQVVATISTMEKSPLSTKQGLTLYRQGVELIDRNYSKSDQQKGLALISQAAQSDISDAQLYLAQLYQVGKIVEKNRPLAALWIEKAAKLGNPEAQYALGWLYYHGEGVLPDRQKAYDLFAMAGQSGDKRSVIAANFVKSQLGNDKLARIATHSKARHAHTL